MIIYYQLPLHQQKRNEMKNTCYYVLLKNDTTKLNIDMEILGVYPSLRACIGKDGVLVSVKNNDRLETGKTIRECTLKTNTLFA